MARKALELLIAGLLFFALILVTYRAWNGTKPLPPIASPPIETDLQASPPSTPPSPPPQDEKRPPREKKGPPQKEMRRPQEEQRKKVESPYPRRLPGLDAPLPKNLETRLEEWETPVLQAHFSTSMEHAGRTQRANIALTARRLAGTVLRAGEVFSFVNRLGPFNRAHGYGCGRTFVGDRVVKRVGGGICQVASTLYNAVVSADLKVLERHPHSLTVPYLPPGQDATISSSSGKDFRFRNDNKSPVVIWSTTAGAYLHMWIFGRRPPPRVAWRHQVLGRTPFKTIREVDPSLPAGQERVASPGQPGARVHSVIIVDRGGKTSTRDLGTHRYSPSPRIIRVGR